jgi:ring-1,2-phenylacetyl-CoA epoxidase subunit PaaC
MVPQLEAVLRLADTNLIWSHRISEWCGHGPMLEEDIALANIALDVLGQARYLLQHASVMEAQGRNEDTLAYFRDAAQFRNVTLAELPNADYAHTIVRNLALSAYHCVMWKALAQSTEAQLAAIAQKAIKESSYHFRHAGDWFLRMGDSTPEARVRLERAMAALWPYTNELFTSDAVERAAGGIVPLSEELRAPWAALLTPLFEAATVPWPQASSFQSTGKRGIHSEHLSYLLAEMQSVARADPEAVW